MIHLPEVLDRRHPSTRHLMACMLPLSDLEDDRFWIAQEFFDMGMRLCSRLGDGAELAQGLRKLVEAKECFFRQSVFDQQSFLAEPERHAPAGGL